MVLYAIDKNLCSACGLCADVCPVEAISQIGEYRINPDICTECGICQEDCPSSAILKIKKTRTLEPNIFSEVNLTPAKPDGSYNMINDPAVK